ncbi:hypothetical protein JIN84_03665 [Luteolibacter yonseiensis]|uniref:Transmembrane protein n=1 Tax=Luteolibacter yonseiensis TaxID=1144680 RepID=A0A934R398_9BACT|nr:hypothetical protein [Luteolibacter yonseiensis]MBK1814695.1 hypothetical protein [Luteolibacter yonseiensis]
MSTTVDQKYKIRTALFMGGYVLVNVAAIFGAFDDMKPPGTWAFALVVAAPVAGHLWALLRWMQDSDEFVRAISAKRFIAATGITMALVSAWGFMEVYAKAPHFPLVMVLPGFWAVWGFTAPFIRTTH